MNCAKQKLCIRRFRAEANRTSSTCPFQESPIQRTGCSDYWMSTVFEIVYHVCGSVPPFLQVCTCAFHTIFLLVEQEKTNVQAEIFSVKLDRYRIRTTFSGISTLNPIDVLNYEHEDDSIFKFFWTSLTECHSVLNLFENLQCFCVLGKHSTPTHLVLHRFHMILCTSWTVRNIEADLSSFLQLLSARASVPDKELSRRVLWPSPT